jgi:hypothetical protein
MGRARHVPGGVFGLPAHVQDLEIRHLAAARAQLVHRDLRALRQGPPGAVPVRHPAREVTVHPLQPHAGEADGRLRRARLVLGDQDDAARGGHQRADPRGELAAQADVEGAREVTGGMGGARPDVQEHGPVAGRGLDRGRGEGRRRRLPREGRRSLAVDLHVHREVGRHLGQVRGHHLDERVPAHRLQRVVGAALGADGGPGVGGDVLPAEGARPVGRVDEHVVGELQQLAVERVVERPRHRLRRDAAAAREVGTADVADEQRVSVRTSFGWGDASVSTHSRWRRSRACGRASPGSGARPAEADLVPVPDGAGAGSARPRAEDHLGPGAGGDLRCPLTKSAWRWVSIT